MEENINPEQIESFIEKIKNNERKKQKKKMNTPFYQTVIMIILGIFISFFSQCEVSIANTLLEKYINWNKLKMIISTIEFFVYFIFSSIFAKFKYTKFKFIYLFISILYCIKNYIYYYGFTRNTFQFPSIANFWTFIILVCYNLYKFRNKLYQLPQLYFIGIFFALLANIIQFISSYFEIKNNLDDPFRFIFYYSDHRNNFLAFLSGLSTSLIYILMENYINERKEIINSLPHIGIYSFLFCLIITIYKKEFNHINSSRKIFPINYLIFYIGLVILNIIILFITPFFINKCSALVIGICCSMRLFFKFFINQIFKTKHYQLTNPGHLFAFFFFILGIGFVCFEIMKDNYPSSKESIGALLPNEDDQEENLFLKNRK